MKKLIVSTAYLMTALSAPGAAPTATGPDMTTALERLQSYGIINIEPAGEYDDSVEILQHYAKYTNGDEGINEFPYCVRLIEASHEDNQLPVSCLRPFVEAGATVQGKDGDTSPLQAAAEMGNVKVVNYLLEAGADIHYTDAELRTALDYALKGELTPAHCDVVRELLRHHALPTSAAMCYAARYHTELLRDMLQNSGTPAPEVVNAAVWNADSLEYLLQHGANPFACTDNGTTLPRALLQRISTGKWQVDEIARLTDLLVAYRTPFYCACPREEIELMLPEDMQPALRERLLALYTTRPMPTFAETDESDVEEVTE